MGRMKTTKDTDRPRVAGWWRACCRDEASSGEATAAKVGVVASGRRRLGASARRLSTTYASISPAFPGNSLFVPGFF